MWHIYILTYTSISLSFIFYYLCKSQSVTFIYRIIQNLLMWTRNQFFVRPFVSKVWLDSFFRIIQYSIYRDIYLNFKSKIYLNIRDIKLYYSLASPYFHSSKNLFDSFVIAKILMLSLCDNLIKEKSILYIGISLYWIMCAIVELVYIIILELMILSKCFSPWPSCSCCLLGDW